MRKGHVKNRGRHSRQNTSICENPRLWNWLTSSENKKAREVQKQEWLLEGDWRDWQKPDHEGLQGHKEELGFYSKWDGKEFKLGSPNRWNRRNWFFKGSLWLSCEERFGKPRKYLGRVRSYISFDCCWTKLFRNVVAETRETYYPTVLKVWYVTWVLLS